MKKTAAIDDLVRVMRTLRSPQGCPWDREQTHRSLRFHAVEEVYELIDAIERRDDQEMVEELGDVLFQVVFHAQLAKERGAFDFDKVARNLVQKLVRRHPHVFGTAKVNSVEGVWRQWEQIKKEEKHGTPRHRPSALDGIPRHLPALLRAEKLIKKARKAQLISKNQFSLSGLTKLQIAERLFRIVESAQAQGWSAEELLRSKILRIERVWRLREKKRKLRSA